VASPLTLALQGGKSERPWTSSGPSWDDLDGADVILAGDALLRECRMTAAMLAGRLPRAVVVRVTPFGDSGPYAGFAALPGVLYGLSGYAYTTGDPRREPLIGPPSIPGYMAGANAYIGTLAALRRRAATGQGDLVEVSELESLAAAHQWTVARYEYSGRIMPRNNSRYDSLHPVCYYACADGTVSVSPSTEDQLTRMVAAMGREDILEDERFKTNFGRITNADAFDAELRPWFEARTRNEIAELFQAFRVPTASALDMLELRAHPQLEARGFWEQREAGSGTVSVPGAPFRLAQPGTPASSRAASRPTAPASSAPLAGIRVLDLTRVWSGPLGTRILGDLGAEVIKVEHPMARGPAALRVLDPIRRTFYPDGEPGTQPWNTNASFNKLNRNKLSLTLDLSHDAGREAFLDLAAVADVVIENYSPRVMGNLGLGFEQLAERNPGISLVSMPGYGLDGPMRDGVAYGSTLDAEAGIASLLGYPGGELQRLGVALPDPVAGMHAAGSVLTALAQRDRTGRGVHVDLSQLESMASLLGDELVTAQVLGQPRERMGNRHPQWAPHGVYPALGEDQWIFIGVTGEDEWAALCSRIAALDDDTRFATMASRKQHEVALDEAVARWTSRQLAGEAMELLQAAGVAAGAVWDAAHLCGDPHLAARGFFLELDHSLIGRHRYAGQPIRFAGSKTVFGTDAPLLGQHNDLVLGKYLGYTAERIDAMKTAGTIVDRPPL
jgi:crotonobetainyl-CoA:carnitine CoA-transferase CaiB-like acyl-CoA transferase